MMFTGHHPVGSGQVKSVNTEIPHQLKRPTNRSEWLPTDRPFDSATTCIGEFHSSVSLLHSSRRSSGASLRAPWVSSSPSPPRLPLSTSTTAEKVLQLQSCKCVRERENFCGFIKLCQTTHIVVWMTLYKCKMITIAKEWRKKRQNPQTFLSSCCFSRCS